MSNLEARDDAPPAEEARLEALRRYDILDTEPEAAFDDLARLAAYICGTPIALVSLLDRDRQWFKARVGLDAAETPIEQSICAHALPRPEPVFVVPDAQDDARFADNPSVTGGPRVRFYAGAKLVSPEGQAIGTLCVMDRVPRDLSEAQLEALEALSRQAVAQMELRRKVKALEDARAYQRETLARSHALQRVSQALVSQAELGPLLQALADTVAQVLPADRAAFILFDPEQAKVTHFARGGPGADKVVETPYAELLGGLSGWALAALAPAVSPKDRPDPRESAEARRRRAETDCGAIVVTPVRHQRQVMGTLTVINRPDQPDFSEDDVDLLDAIASQAAAAVSNARLLAETARQARELDLLDRVQEDIARDLDPPALLRSVVESVAEVFGYPLVSIYLLQGDELALQHQVGYGQVIERFPVGQGVVSRVVASGEPALIRDVDLDPDFLAAFDGITSEVCVPLFAGGEVAGVLNVESADPEPLGPGDLRVAQAVAAQVGLALERARLYAAVREGEALYRGLVTALAEGVVVQDRSGRIAAANPAVEAILGLTPDQMEGRSSLDPSWRAVREDGSDFPGSEHPSMAALATGRPQSNVVMGVHKPDGRLTWISVNAQPLFREGQTEAHAVVTSFFDITDTRAMQEALRQQAVRDPLTGLFNRRYLEETLARELAKARHDSGRLAVVMLDVDHFKRLNDRFGHDAGDAVLRLLARLLEGSVRSGDAACRYGGEEFTLVLPGADLPVALRRAEQLREAAKGLSPEHGGRQLGPLTLSLGVAAYPEHGAGADALLKAADDALYRAKQAGRDRVESASAPDGSRLSQ